MWSKIPTGCPEPDNSPEARLNFAENLLRCRDDSDAIVFRGENQVRRRLSYAELYSEVSRLAQALREPGVTMGDRVGEIHRRAGQGWPEAAADARPSVAENRQTLNMYRDIAALRV